MVLTLVGVSRDLIISNLETLVFAEMWKAKHRSRARITPKRKSKRGRNGPSLPQVDFWGRDFLIQQEALAAIFETDPFFPILHTLAHQGICVCLMPITTLIFPSHYNTMEHKSTLVFTTISGKRHDKAAYSTER